MTAITQFSKARNQFLRQSPPARGRSAEASPGVQQTDQVRLSEAAAAPSGGGLLKTALLAGMAVLAVGSMAAPSAAQAFGSEAVAAPFEMVRAQDGKVVFYTGIGDEAIEPLAPTHREVPGIAGQAWQKRGQTVCEQAIDLGGICDNDDAATVPTLYGDLIVERNTPNSLDIYSNDGGHVGMRREIGGVDVRTGNGGGYFYNSGRIDYHR